MKRAKSTLQQFGKRLPHYVFERYQIPNRSAHIEWLIFTKRFSIGDSSHICCGCIVRRMWWNIGCESVDDINRWAGLQLSGHDFKLIRSWTELHRAIEWHRQQCIINSCSSGAIHCRNSNATCKISNLEHFISKFEIIECVSIRIGVSIGMATSILDHICTSHVENSDIHSVGLSKNPTV